MSVKTKRYYRAQEVKGNVSGKGYLLQKIKTKTVAKAPNLKGLVSELNKVIDDANKPKKETAPKKKSSPLLSRQMS